MWEHLLEYVSKVTVWQFAVTSSWSRVIRLSLHTWIFSGRSTMVVLDGVPRSSPGFFRFRSSEIGVQSRWISTLFRNDYIEIELVCFLGNFIELYKREPQQAFFHDGCLTALKRVPKVPKSSIRLRGWSTKNIYTEYHLMCCQLVCDNLLCLPQKDGPSINILITCTSLQMCCHIYWYKKKFTRGPITIQTHAEIYSK